MNNIESKEIKTRLAKYISTLPSDSVAELAKLDEQIKYLKLCKQDNKYISVCWEARINGRNDPLLELLDKNQIKESKHQAIYNLIELFESLWGVIQIGWNHLQHIREFNDEFDNAEQLFKEILKTLFDNEFLLCTKHHWGLTQSEWHKGCEIGQRYLNSLRKNVPVEESTVQELKSVTNISSELDFIWLHASLSICISKSTQDPTLKDKLENSGYRASNLLSLGEECSKHKRASKKRPKSISLQIINGAFYPSLNAS